VSAPLPDRMPADGVLARPEVAKALALLDSDGEEARLVGGAVRNSLLDLPLGDIDIATTALPRAVMKRARKAGIRALPTGVEHGTVTLLVEGHPIEVTTLREDIATDGRRAVVTFGRSFAHDALRRDFTMNALYADREGRVVDEVGGLADLAARRVRFIGDPETRIREDYLRILRLFRFHAAYGEGPLDRDALLAAIRLRDGLSRLSSERVRAELLKLLAARRAAEVVPEVAEAGLLQQILCLAPDTRAFARVRSGGEAEPMALLAALAVRTREDGMLLREHLRLSNAETRHLTILGLVLEALHADPTKAESLRVLAYRHGAGPARQALAIAAARQGIAAPERDRLLAVLDGPLPALPFTGAGIVAAGVRPGPQVGAVLARAEALWLDDGMPSEPEACRTLLERALALEAVPSR
jgi:poly(A) polymerase